MRRSTAYLLTLMLVIALSLEPLLVGVRYSGASPDNVEYDGTSNLIQLLRMWGYNTYVIKGWDFLARPNVEGSCNVLMIISPEKPYYSYELNVIEDLTFRGTHVIIADEGVFSNAVLNALKSHVRISNTRVYVGSEETFEAVVEIGGVRHSIYFAYASALNVTGGGVKVLSEVGGFKIVVEENLSKSKLLVIGDGSIFTNAALITSSSINPYVRFLNSILTYLCGDKPPTVIVDGSKYGLEAEPLSKLITSGDISYLIASLINPLRLRLAVEDAFLTYAFISFLIVLLFFPYIYYRVIADALPRHKVKYSIVEELSVFLKFPHILARELSDVCISEAPEEIKEVCRGGRKLLSEDSVKWLIDLVAK